MCPQRLRPSRTGEAGPHGVMTEPECCARWERDRQLIQTAAIPAAREPAREHGRACRASASTSNGSDDLKKSNVVGRRRAAPPSRTSLTGAIRGRPSEQRPRRPMPRSSRLRYRAGKSRRTAPWHGKGKRGMTAAPARCHAKRGAGHRARTLHLGVAGQGVLGLGDGFGVRLFGDAPTRDSRGWAGRLARGSGTTALGPGWRAGASACGRAV